MLLAVTMLLFSVTVSAYDFMVDGLCYNILDTVGTVEVTFLDWNYNYNDSVIKVPSSVTYNEKTYNVKSIGDYAFKYCYKLTDVIISAGIERIEYCAFFYSEKLENIRIPSTVEYIENGVFDGTAWWNKLPNQEVYAGSILYGYKGEMPENTVIDVKHGTKRIRDYAFVGCKNLTKIIIPELVFEIGRNAFHDCTGLTEISANAFRRLIIGDRAFLGCTALENIKFAPRAGIVSIGESAFSKCKGLKDVTINADSVAPYTFAECTNLKRVIIEEGVKCIGENAFEGCTMLDSVVLPSSVHSVYSRAFNKCTALTNITISEGVKVIHPYAFLGCSALKKVELPSSLESVGLQIFRDCTGLTEVVIPEGVKCIETSAFSNCSSLTTVKIPASVSRIEGWAFEDCTGLTSVKMVGFPPELNYSAFQSHYENTILYVPKGLLEAYMDVTNNWRYFKNIQEYEVTGIEDVEADAPAFEITADGVRFADAEGRAVAVYTAAGAVVTKIDSYAGEEIALDKGAYIVRVGNKTLKVRL